MRCPRKPQRSFVELLELRYLLSAAFDVTGLTALRSNSAFTSIDGSGVGIAVLDSGVYAKNPDLSSNVAAFYNAVENPLPASISSSSVSSASDNEGHGTHVSGIAASSNPSIGVAYRASLIDVKVIPDANESQLGGDPLLRGLQFVAQYADQFNIKVVNMSLGESDQNGGLNINSAPAADDIAREIQELESLGITVVTAAGNSYANDPTTGESYPAIVSTLAVGSSWADSGAGYNFNVVAWGTDTDNYAAYENSAAADRFSATSQRSTATNMVVAPGVNIYSTWNDSSSSGTNLLYNTLSGTSMATPFVSGVVALMQDAAKTFGGRYITDPQLIRQILQNTADVITDSNVADNGRVPLVNGSPNTSQNLNLPETGLTYDRIDVLKAIQYVRNLFSGGSITNADLDKTASTATQIPALTGTRTFSGRGTIGTDGLNPVGANDVDLYALTLSSPGTISAVLSLPSGGTSFSSVVRLFDSAGNQIQTISGSYPTLLTDTANPLPVGTYYLGVSSAGNNAYTLTGAGAANGSSTGDYLLSISLSNPDPNGVAQGAVSVDLTAPTATIPNTRVVANYYAGDIGSDPPPVGESTRIQVPNGDVDMFKLIAPDNGTLTIQTSTSAYGSSAVDSYVRVFDASLNQIAFNDDISQFNTDSFVQVSVTLGQTYYVAVTNYDNRTFDVRNPYGRVANSTPTDKFYDFYLSFNNNDANGDALLASSETVGHAVSDSVGADNGTPLTGANSGFKDVDFYTFAASSAGLLDFGVSSSAISPNLALWALTSDQSSINRIGSVTGAGSHLIEQVTAGQTLYVSVTGKGNENFNWFSLASGTGGQTGAYSLASNLRPLSDLTSLSDNSLTAGTPQTLTLDTALFGQIGLDNSLITGDTDIDLYKFVAPDSASFDFQTDTSREGSADTYLRLFDANGNVISSNDNQSSSTTSSFVRADLVAGQTYYLGVSGSGNSSYSLSSGSGTASGSTGSYTVMASRTSLPTLSLSDATPVREPTPGSTSFSTFLITLDRASDTPVTVSYATVDGTATANSDYTPAAGILTFSPGQTSQTLSIPILGDLTTESDETFTLSLSSPSNNVILTHDVGTATIQDLAVRTSNLDAKHPLTYTDALGHKVTLRLTGPGAGVITFFSAAAANPALISLTHTTAATSLTVTPVKGTTSLGDLNIQGSLKSLIAPSTIFTGNLTFTGSLKTLTASALRGDDSTFHASSIFSLNITGAISNLTLTTGTLTHLTAGSLSHVQIKAAGGKPRPGAAPSINTLTIRGSISNSIIRTAGNLSAIIAASLSNTQIFAGVDDAVTTLPTSAADLVGAATLSSVRITGSVTNSQLAASQITAAFFGKTTSTTLAAKKFVHYQRRINNKPTTALPTSAHPLPDAQLLH